MLTEFTVSPSAPGSGSGLTITAKRYSHSRVLNVQLSFKVTPSAGSTSVFSRTVAANYPNPVAVTTGPLSAELYQVQVTLSGVEQPSGNILNSSKTMSVTVSDCGAPPWIGDDPRPTVLSTEPILIQLPAATAGVAYDYQLPVRGDAPPFTVMMAGVGLPSTPQYGLAMSESGRITGTPARRSGLPADSDVIGFGVADSCAVAPRVTKFRAIMRLLSDCGTTPVSLYIDGARRGTTGAMYREELKLEQNPLNRYPDGLSAQIVGGTGAGIFRLERTSSPAFNAERPELSRMNYQWFLTGIPSAPGTYTVEILAQDECSPPQTATETFTIEVTSGVGCSPALTAPSQAPPLGTVGNPFSFAISTTGGVGAVTYALSTDLGLDQLPPGLTLSGATVSGTPTTPGTTPVRIVAMDSCPAANGGPQRVNIDLTFEVEPAGCPALSFATTSLAAAEVGVPYGATLLASGGVPPYTWTVVGGSLPSWATLTTAGTLTGTPPSTTGSPFSFTVQVADACAPAQTVTRAFTLTVNPFTGPLWDHSELLNRYQAPTTGESAVGLLPNGRPFILMSAMDGLASGRPQGLILITGNIADPINSTDWNVFSMTPGEVVDFSRPFAPAAAIIDGRLCVMHRTVDGLRYARALTGTPAALSDFNITLALDQPGAAATSVGQGLVNLGGKPAYVFLYSEVSQHLHALIASSSTPGASTDWTLHPLLEDAAGRKAEYPQAQVIGGRLAVAFIDRDLSGATIGEPAAPAFALAQVDEPTGAADWLLYLLTAPADLKTLPGFTQLSDRLCIAAGTGDGTTDGQSVHLYKANLQWPLAATDWTRVTVPIAGRSARGYHCHLTLAGMRLLLSVGEQSIPNKIFVSRAQVGNPGGSASDWLTEEVDATWSEPTSPMAILVGGKARVVYPSAWDEDVYWGYRASPY